MDFHDQVIAAAQLINGNVPSSEPQTGPDRPVPQVSDVDLASQDSRQHIVEAVIESLKVSGACIVRNMVSKEGLDEIEKDIRPHLNTAKVWQGTDIPLQQPNTHTTSLVHEHVSHTNVSHFPKATSTRWNREE